MPTDARHIAKGLGRVIRKLRLDAGWSQIKLAEKADLNFNYVGSVERGEKVASIEVVVRIARALGTTGADLLEQAEL